jgi:hypothetical protein
MATPLINDSSGRQEPRELQLPPRKNPPARHPDACRDVPER